MTEPSPLFRRIVVTKGQTYELVLDQMGMSAAAIFGEAETLLLGLMQCTT